jgi:ubiquinone/menaquinone biosynthesis C-methylase UbiE
MTVSRFDRRASTYEDSALQQFLFGPAQDTALQLALRQLPRARRILDVGCGTGRLLRRARPCYPLASLVGIDLAGQMLASATTLTRRSVQLVHARAEQLPFPDEVFDLVFTTMSLRHWTNPRIGIAEIGRVLTADGALILADVFPTDTPVELGGMLARHGLAVTGRDRTPWFRLPDVQVISARKSAAAPGPWGR